MHTYNDRKLARRLRDGTVPPREQFYYFLLMQLLMSCFLTQSYREAIFEPVEFWGRVDDILSIGSLLVAMPYIFRLNAQGDGKDFIMRTTCLLFPITVQVLLFALGLMIFSVVLTIAGIDLSGVTQREATLIDVVVMTYTYLRLAGSIKIASGSQAPSSDAP